MTTVHDKKPPLAEPRENLEFDLPEVEAFLALPLEERRRRLDRVSAAFQQIFAGTTVDEMIAEKRREAARE